MTTDKTPDAPEWLNISKLPDNAYIQFDCGRNQAAISDAVYYANGDVVEWPAIIEEDESK